MSLENLRPSPVMKEFLPVEYRDLVDHGPYNNRNGKDTQSVKVTDISDSHRGHTELGNAAHQRF